MSGLSWFVRQVAFSRSGNRGQATTLFLVTSLVMVSLVYSAAYLSHEGVRRVSSANSIDAIAISAATWEARCLNVIAALNDGVSQCFRLIRWICAVWAALAVAAATGVGIPAFQAYTDYAKVAIRNLWERAREFARWSDRVRAMAPGLVLSETATLCSRLEVVGVLHPSNPRGRHDSESTLELHLERGEPLGLADALAPILGVKTGKPARKILNPILAGLLAANPEPIRLLRPEADFGRRQRVRFTGYRTTESVLFPWVGNVGGRRYPFTAWACPYGGGATEMSWKSRLFEPEEDTR